MLTTVVNFDAWPSFISGVNFHCFTAASDAMEKTAFPLTTFASSTSPDALTVNETSCAPLKFNCFAAGGYSGWTFFTTLAMALGVASAIGSCANDTPKAKTNIITAVLATVVQI
jgi:hypothetical protein